MQDAGEGERGFAALSQEWATIRDTLVRPVLWREFFKEYDLRSLPDDPVHGIPANTKLDAAQKAQRRTDVLAMVGAGPDRLVARRSKRAAEALAGRIMPPTPVPAALKPAVERLSKMQLDLFERVLPERRWRHQSRSVPGRVRAVRQRAVAPAGREPDHIGEPRGDFYFLFAEFAFACVDSGIKKDEWEPLLRTFVKTQEIFIHVYRPAPGGGAAFPLPPSVWGAAGAPPAPGAARRSLDGAFDFTNFNPRGQSNATRKAALRKKYRRHEDRRAAAGGAGQPASRAAHAVACDCGAQLERYAPGAGLSAPDGAAHDGHPAPAQGLIYARRRWEQPCVSRSREPRP